LNFYNADVLIIVLCVSALTLANTNYILLQSKKSDEAKEILRKLKLIVKVLSLDEKVLGLSLNDSDFMNFEDALHNFSAIENEVDIIITRNLKDLKNQNYL
jgi:hypothetical protein